jgi:small subunit ribosomal protein S6
MRRYEVMIILDPDLEEKTIAPSLEAFLNVIRSDGGSVKNIDQWGKRRFAYEIDHKSEGYYVVLDLEATPAAVAELDRQLNLNEAIIRTKVTRPQLVAAEAK